MMLQAVDAVRRWLNDCRATHSKCRVKRDGFMPRRLIQIIGKDISALPCNPLMAIQFSEVPTLKLVELDHPVPYVALSYCWGTNRDQWITSTKATVERHRQGTINTWLMPRTIAEAIQISRLLGFEYIWVDAICIIQDDPEDWTAEAARMGNVYSAAELVLSANTTDDCTQQAAGFQTFGLLYQTFLPLGGLFSKLAPGVRWEDGLGDPAFPLPDRFTSQDTIILRMAHLHSMVSGASGYQPLDMRAWTCQESLLGRRMLSLTAFECVWTCDESASCECGFSRIVLENQMSNAKKGHMWESTIAYRPVQRLRRAFVEGRVTDDLPCVDTIHNTWRHLVNDYTQRGMAVESDKMVAISGLARIFGKVFSMLSDAEDWDNTTPIYLAGLWRDNIHQDLLWLGQRFPPQLAAALEIGDGKEGSASDSTQLRNGIANKPFAAVAARLKWLSEHPARPAKYRAPSWSWASSNFCISWLLDLTKWEIESGGREAPSIMTPYMTLVKGQIDGTPDEYGAVAAGSITVRGPLVEVRRRRVPLPAEDRERYLATMNARLSPLPVATTVESRASAAAVISGNVDHVHYAFVRSQSGLVFEYYPDDEFDSHPPAQQGTYRCLRDGWQKPCREDRCDCRKGWSEESFWCLRISRAAVREESRPTRLQDGWLVLKRLEERNAYERVGVGYFLKIGSEAVDFRLFDDAVETVVRII
jgi:hypothetical protein